MSDSCHSRKLQLSFGSTRITSCDHVIVSKKFLAYYGKCKCHQDCQRARPSCFPAHVVLDASFLNYPVLQRNPNSKKTHSKAISGKHHFSSFFETITGHSFSALRIFILFFFNLQFLESTKVFSNTTELCQFQVNPMLVSVAVSLLYGDNFSRHLF